MSNLPPDPLLTDILPWWPDTALPRALALIGGAPLPGPAHGPDWVIWACDSLNLQLDQSPTTVSDLPRQLAALSPGLIWHPSERSFLVMARQGWLMRPDGGQSKADLATIQRALSPTHPSLLRQGRRVAGLAGGDDRLAHALCTAARRGDPVTGLWRLRPAPRTLWRTALMARLPHLALAVLALALLVQGIEVSLWAFLGAATLQAVAPAALPLVALLLAPVLLGLGQNLLSEMLARRLAALLRKRLLGGALALPEGALRMDGPEGLLSRGLEAQGFEGALTASILGAPMAMAGTAWAAWVLLQGQAWLSPLFLGLLAVQPLLIRHYLTAARAWTNARRRLTGRMIGWMIGHRSLPLLGTPDAVLATEAPHLAGYARQSATMDRRSLVAFALLPNGWTLIALSLFGYLGLGTGSEARAVTLGGVLLAARAFVAMAGVWASLGAARIAFDQIEPLWQARPAPPEATYPAMPAPGTPRLRLQARLTRPLRGLDLRVNLAIPPAARVWLTGASGAGKSSLLRLLTGAEAPVDGGLFTADTPLPARHVTRAAALVPQFHDNHVFTGSLAYNLLLSRAWPPSPADLTEAQEVAGALGLAPLIARMPSGLSTHLGETGWQLSQGERSRLFLARALLQGAPVLALDESLAALDPVTEAVCLSTLEDWADALVLARHS